MSLNLLLSTGWKLVSFLLSKPTPNSICGTEQEPKSPMLDEDPEEVEALVVAAAAAWEVVLAAAFVVVASDAEVSDPDPDPVAVPAMTFPWSSTADTEAKFVVIPKTALNASA